MGKDEYGNIDKIGNTFEDQNPDTDHRFCAYDKKTRERIVRNFFQGEKKERVLDLGCSIGAWSLFLRKQKSKYIIGVDISKERLDLAKKRGYDEVALANGTNLPFKDNYFDLIVCTDVLVHVLKEKSWKKIFKEANRTLKPGGVFIFSIPSRRAKLINDVLRFPIKLWRTLKGTEKKIDYCVYRSYSTIVRIIEYADFEIEAVRSCRFSYPDPLIKFPNVLYGLDKLFGNSPLKKFGHVIFFKVRKVK